ncbi:carbohydrate binding family 9 domain-containing protein [Corallococcus exercitus]|uniref:Carbohydrate binding family 9 domain-containing protein n=2 Tax=Pseudomonadati TaxID=3379134 RepID=A0A7Y4NVS2_9BACT|nr:carbohydrate binding family 9 domain-containing protein [Corallococcus exercitus]NOK39335.1 carbohydrate binding family 9 domain-containing protein [Corallococcus exercitus]
MSPLRHLCRWGTALLAALVPTLGHADSTYKVTATRTQDAITIDGKGDEPAWQAAPEISGWYLTRINYGKPAPDDTKVRILYDQDNLYFLFHCLDSKPERITGYTVQNEGFLHQEDNITIILDTFLDHRNAYYFWTNPLGVRTDGRIVDDGEAFSTNWRGEWETKSTIVKDGWISEVRIPFANFQFETKDEISFGMLLDREQSRNQEWSNWTPDGVNSAKVSRYPHLEGLKGIKPRSIFSITPYVATTVALKTTDDRGVFRPNVGADARIDPAPWLSVKLTANPDFSDAEADQSFLLLDTDQPLLPERRAFFTESEHLFIAPINVFTSRRIALRPHDRVWGGLQLTGKLGGLSFSMMDVQHRDSTGRDANGREVFENVNSGVLRLQQDIGKRSMIALVAINRSGRGGLFGDSDFQTVGVDGNFHLFEEFFIQAQALKSWSPLGNEDSDAYHVGLHRFDTLSEFWLQFEDIGKNYANPLGWTPVVDKQGYNSRVFVTPFPKWRFLPRIDVTWDSLWRRNHEHERTRWRNRLNVQPYLHHDFALYLEGIYDDNLGFRDRLGTFGFTLFPHDWQSYTLTAVAGRFLGGEIRGFNGSANLKIGPHIVARFSGFYTRNFNVPTNSDLYGTSGDGYSFSGYAQLRYHFSPDLYARLTLQKGGVYELADYNAVKGTFLDAMVGWHYRQWSDIFLVYTDQPFGGSQERRILSKISFNY